MIPQRTSTVTQYRGEPLPPGPWDCQGNPLPPGDKARGLGTSVTYVVTGYDERAHMVTVSGSYPLLGYCLIKED